MLIFRYSGTLTNQSCQLARISASHTLEEGNHARTKSHQVLRRDQARKIYPVTLILVPYVYVFYWDDENSNLEGYL